MQIYAGSESVPVISQSLGILSSLGLAVLNDENNDGVPPDAIVLAACCSGARLPNRFLRRMPETFEARRLEISSRQLGIPEQVLLIPRLVLIRPSRTGNGRYSSEGLEGLTAALRDLADIKLPKMKRNRGRSTHSRAEGGIQPYLVH